MSDGDPDRPQSDPRRSARWTLATTAALLLAAAAFATGRATAPDGNHQAQACDDAQRVYRENIEAGTELLNSVQREDDIGWADDREFENDRTAAHVSLSTAFNAVSQNPDCFTTEERATAQTYLDDLGP